MMLRTTRLSTFVFAAALAAASVSVGCDEDEISFASDAGSTDTTSGGNLMPSVPEPASLNEMLPEQSADLIVGLSAGLEEFYPHVNELEMMGDDGSFHWVALNRPVWLACPGHLPMCTCQADAADATFISARPHLLHTRHWRLLGQATLSPGGGFELTETVTWGSSTTHQENRTFSTTVGVTGEIGAAWKALSASISASYSQTTTATQIDSVTFSEETSQEKSFPCAPPERGTRVCAVWQLVDEFRVVDADMVPIHESATVSHALIPAVPSIQFPSEKVVRVQTTDFD